MRSAFFIFIIVLSCVTYFWTFQSNAPFSYQNESGKKNENYTKNIEKQSGELLSSTTKNRREDDLSSISINEAQNATDDSTTISPTIEERQSNDNLSLSVAKITNYAKPSTLVQAAEQSISTTQKKDVETEKGKKTAKNELGHNLAPLFEKTSVESQFFELYSNKAAVLKAKKGTVLALPEACFVDEKNKVATGYIEVEVKELFGKSEMLLSNLSTVSQYDVLTSEGAIYISAKNIHGKKLSLAPYKTIYVEMPSKKRTADAWIYQGEHNEKGEISWVATSRQKPRLISFPLHSLHFDKADLSDDLYKKITSEDYENTLIATREFEERLLFIQKNKHIHGNRIEPILDYFFNNLHKNLFEIDYLLHAYFKSLLKVYPYQDGDYVEEIKALSEQFRRFYEEKLTTVLHSRPYNIDLADEKAFQKLRQKGMSSEKAHHFINLYQYGAAVIEDRKENNSFLAQKQIGKRPYAKNTFVINKTGWGSVDGNLSKNYQKRKLEVQLENSKGVPTAVYMLLRDRMTLVPALKKENLETNSVSYMLKNLPNREKGYVIALGYKNGQPFIDVQSIEVGKQDVANLKMRPTTIDMLSYQIAQLN